MPALALALFAFPAFSATVNMGIISFDETTPPLAAVDITNQTGPNSTGDASFPVTTSVGLSNLNLTINFVGGSTETFGPGSGYFTLSADGLSFDGNPVFNVNTQPIASLTLTGTYNATSITLFDGTKMTIDPSFSITLTDNGGGSKLVDGDFAVFTASPGSSGGGVPEPAAWGLLGTGLITILLARFRKFLRH